MRLMRIKKKAEAHNVKAWLRNNFKYKEIIQVLINNKSILGIRLPLKKKKKKSLNDIYVCKRIKKCMYDMFLNFQSSWRESAQYQR